MGFFDDFTNILLALVALVVAIAAFERSWIVWQAQRKRERQNRTHQKDV
jgi:DNA-directed RNA polymerase alpha subunit